MTLLWYLVVLAGYSSSRTGLILIISSSSSSSLVHYDVLICLLCGLLIIDEPGRTSPWQPVDSQWWAVVWPDIPAGQDTAITASNVITTDIKYQIHWFVFNVSRISQSPANTNQHIFLPPDLFVLNFLQLSLSARSRNKDSIKSLRYF